MHVVWGQLTHVLKYSLKYVVRISISFRFLNYQTLEARFYLNQQDNKKLPPSINPKCHEITNTGYS